jgi:hypothetical protein
VAAVADTDRAGGVQPGAVALKTIAAAGRQASGGLDRQLQIRCVIPAGVDDVLPTVLGDVIAGPGHDRPQCILRADDQPELFVGVEHQTDWEQIDFDVLVQMAGGRAQASVRALVSQHRCAPLGEVLNGMANREVTLGAVPWLLP